MKAAFTRKDLERLDESEGEDVQEEVPDSDPDAVADALVLAGSSRCFQHHIYYSIVANMTRRKFVRRKDRNGTGFVYQQVDHNVNQYKKQYVVVIVVTESSLLDNIASIIWEHGSVDIDLRHMSDIVDDIGGENIYSATGLLDEITTWTRAGRVASTKRRREETLLDAAD